MQTRIKRWTGLGFSTALVVTALSGCAEGEGEAGDVGETGEAAQTASALVGEAGEGGEGEGGEGGEFGEGEGEGGEGIAAMEDLQPGYRAAFMAGHVEAGLALYRADAPEQAAPHLQHPISETHEAERAGLAALGLDTELFEQVSGALSAGISADETTALLDRAERNLYEVIGATDTDTVDTMVYLLDLAYEEYDVGVEDGAVTDPGEYQDAYGFTVVARKLAEGITLEDKPLIIERLDEMLALWPEGGPLAASTPAPVGQVAAQASRVKLLLGN
ncbi:MAG: hypothetical protein AAF648_05850 [Pseudomonadota bacterium]